MCRNQLESMNLFIRSGERFSPPDDTWDVITLPHPLESAHLPDAINSVRKKLNGASDVCLLIAGPITLGVALGQALAHIPSRIRYFQLNQATKELEEWVRSDTEL